MIKVTDLKTMRTLFANAQVFNAIPAVKYDSKHVRAAFAWDLMRNICDSICSLIQTKIPETRPHEKSNIEIGFAWILESSIPDSVFSQKQ